ncbi:MAG: MFS transporter [Actinomycetota bacterium]|nr:MFS transporter [Actinomycetota bacterium]
MDGRLTNRDIDAQSGIFYGLTHRQLYTYPETRQRLAQLAIVVVATVALYYESYVGGSVSTLLLPKLSMSFTFYVTSIAIGNLLGAVGSLVAGLSDRLGRVNIVVAGLFLTGIMTLFVIPAMSTKLSFVIATFVVTVVEGITLVATPALIRDFSPQTGRATAMGLWTTGPVVGSLIVSLVGSLTITSSTSWQHEYRISGLIGLVVFLIALLWLRELSPGLRDQLMVSMKDRILIEARAKGIDVGASLSHPWRQIIKPDIILSSLAIAVRLLTYYTSVGFGTILLTTIFGFSLKDANGIANWQWGVDALALIVVGVISDRLRVRKPIMIVGAVGGAIITIFFLVRLGRPTSYYEAAGLLAGIALFAAVAQAPWMASFTETIEARNPALTAHGLAVWGWCLRFVVFVSFLLLPFVVNSVTPLVNYGPQVRTYAIKYAPDVAFVKAHPGVVTFVRTHASLVRFARTHRSIIALASKYKIQLEQAQKFELELSVMESHPVIFGQLSQYSNPATVPPALMAQAVTAAGGGATGVEILKTIEANRTTIRDLISIAPILLEVKPYAAQLHEINAYAVQFKQVAAYATQLTSLEQAAPQLAYLEAHAVAVQSAAQQSPNQWKNWYWICFASNIFFILTVPLMKGRWSPKRALEDEVAHEALIQSEIESLQLS